jgi:Xaa-Pro aminopeptidase
MRMLSLAERDRRYGLIRGAMRERGIEALIVKGGDNHYPAEGAGHFRYVTDIINPAPIIAYCTYAILPAEGEPIAFVAARHSIRSVMTTWVTDLRPGSIPHHNMVAGALKDLGLDAARIGIVGLRASFAVIGNASVSVPFYEGLRDALPRADLVDATDILQNARTIKSAEEIAAMEDAEALCAGAFNHLVEIVGPGVPVRSAFAEMQRYVLANGGDTESVIGVECFPEPDEEIRYVESLERTMQRGDFITAISYVFKNGMSGHDHLFVSIGPPSQEAEALVDACRQGTDALLARMAPGVRSDELLNAAHERLESLGFLAPGGDMHHVGLEIPEGFGPAYVIDEGFEHLPRGRRPFRVETGMTLALQVHVKDRQGRGVEGGVSYVITENGYRQLGDVPPVGILQASA